jgi:peptidyl-prolyl cis-trans isomerase SurA
MKTLRHLSIILIIFMGLWTETACAQASVTTTVTPLDKIVVVINNDVITQSQLDKRMAMVRQQMQAAGAPLPDAATFRAHVLDQLIDQKLILMVAQHNNIKVTDVQLDKAINDIAARNHMTPQQLQTAVGQQGMTYAQFRKQINKEWLLARFMLLTNKSIIF